MTQTFDAIIVGAGLSGVVTAKALQDAGKHIAILEARERIGGRIYTASVCGDDVPIDLGPAWFWEHHTHIQAMLKHYDIPHFEQYEDGLGIYHVRDTIPPERFVVPRSSSATYRIVGGVKSIIDALSNDIDMNNLYLGHAVKAITQTDDRLKVTVNDGEIGGIWSAKHVVMTLPPHLAATKIDYQPTLPQAVQSAMIHTPTWMGRAMKVGLVYKSPFWREQGLSGFGVSHAGPVQQFHDASPDDSAHGALFGWMGNHSWGRDLTSDEREKAVIAQATQMFGDDAAHPLGYTEMNWETSLQTFNLEADFIPVVNDHPRYGAEALQTPQMNGRLWWSGTEVSPVEGGYLDGAIYIGQAIAERILAI
ncbi:MAG: NAD(P)/FAD-dependent oxidoreductase [Chloroflexota bacterium]